jgi:hypothetical protein
MEWGFPRARTGARFLLALAFTLGLVSRASAEPVVYEEVIKSAGGSTGASPSGSLGSVLFGGTFSDVVLVFRMRSDTADVMPFTSPVNGAENVVGIASVEVKDAATGAVIAHGDFLNSDGIFVSADNVNGGVGFGSAGAAPGSAGFPGRPAYPYAIAVLTPSGPIDLVSEVTVKGTFVASCVNFPVGLVADCGAPVALATTAGELILNATLGTGTQVGKFRVRRVKECPEKRGHGDDDEHGHDD